ALNQALADEDRLLALYDGLSASDPALRRSLLRVRQDHAAHRAALVAAGALVTSRTPTPSASLGSHPQAQSQQRILADAERAAAAARTAACLVAPRSL